MSSVLVEAECLAMEKQYNGCEDKYQCFDGNDESEQSRNAVFGTNRTLREDERDNDGCKQ